MSTPTPPEKKRRTAREAALGLLARREHSRQELSDKLKRRGYEAAEIDPVLDQLTALNSLSEERATDMRLRHGLESGHGPRRIRANLVRAGLGAEALEENESLKNVDWIAQAKALITRRFGDAAPADYREWGRRARFLEARGFHRGDIRRALGEWKAGKQDENDE